MPWNNLGTVTPTITGWTLFDLSADGELFRATQTWLGDWPGTGHVQISAIYANGGRYGFRRLYADLEPQLFIMAPPPELIEAGLTVRFLAARLNSWARPYSGANWRVQIEEYTPPIP